MTTATTMTTTTTIARKGRGRGGARSSAASIVGRVVASAVALLVAPSGCGKTKDFGTGSKSIPQQVAETVCPKAYQCCTTMQLMGNDLAGTDVATCQTKTTNGFQNQLAAITASQNQGRSVYNANKLDACLATIRNATCDALDVTNHLSGVPGCNSFVTPQVAIGGACTHDWECIDGWCSVPAMTSGDGTCRPRAVGGASCAVDMCAAGAICTADTKTCVVLGGTGADCTTLYQCASGVCDIPTGAGAGTCAPPAPTSCFYASGCAVAEGPPTRATWPLAALVAALALRRGARRARAPLTPPTRGSDAHRPGAFLPPSVVL